MKNNPIPTASKFTVLRQLCNLIPPHLVPRLARETGVDEQARTYSPWSHVVTMLYAQLAHSISLNDVADALQLNSGPLSAVRGATRPSRNNLSHANKERDAALPERLFWAMLEHLQALSPDFGGGRAGKRFVKQLRRKIYAVDSTTIQLLARCLDWARHRRRKAGAKAHVRLDLQSFLPRCAIIDTAREADGKRAAELCADLEPGEIVMFDRAYVNFGHLGELDERGVIWVTRAKENLRFTVLEVLPVPAASPIISDELIGLETSASQQKCPAVLRRVVAWVEVDGRPRPMTFLTNQLTWSPQTIAELYACRWRIEVFFKQIKQTLQLADFLGSSANAVRWQVWTAFLVYLLLRYLAYLGQWTHSFSRLFALVRTGIWRKWDLVGLVKAYGTAGEKWRYQAHPEQAYFPGFT